MMKWCSGLLGSHLAFGGSSSSGDELSLALTAPAAQESQFYTGVSAARRRVRALNIEYILHR